MRIESDSTGSSGNMSLRARIIVGSSRVPPWARNHWPSLGMPSTTAVILENESMCHGPRYSAGWPREKHDSMDFRPMTFTTDWIESLGGPRLLAPRSSLKDWLGGYGSKLPGP